MEARRRRRGAFFRRNRLTIIAVGIALLILALVVGWVVSLSNPYRSILRKADVDVEKVQVKKDVVTLTFEGDSVGILSCRSALNALRAKKAPQTVKNLTRVAPYARFRGILTHPPPVVKWAEKEGK